ncbi:hypothetical protein Q3A66_17385 [Hymenobacter sp. BT770]|uniref:hypothetical protein n=1 Tax=Hymenobacter sp. BT770 TaxID=2886942 RepID=UPI001D118092|nr:hypothetical protein [Hymenobacter sp. BT770]MCC3154948.1 hypothetical protein [Hymenobacter sp. BT770]MDO3416844.1 hypothetical protein [Hymenobacter sp. BT770]
MKFLKATISFLALLVMTTLPATTVLAQKAPKVIAIVNRADWCGTCKAHGPRVMALVPNYARKPIVFALNDLSNPTTVAASKERLTKLGVENVQGPMIYTGVILLVDAGTHQVLKTVSMAEPNAQIEAEITQALAQK